MWALGAGRDIGGESMRESFRYQLGGKVANQQLAAAWRSRAGRSLMRG